MKRPPEAKFSGFGMKARCHRPTVQAWRLWVVAELLEGAVGDRIGIAGMAKPAALCHC